MQTLINYSNKQLLQLNQVVKHIQLEELFRAHQLKHQA